MITDVLNIKDLTIGYRHKKNAMLFGQNTNGRISEIAKDLNLSLNRGELVCLLGPNGSGKSTLMRTMSGIQSPLSGRVELLGKPLTKLSAKDIALNLSVVLTDRISIGNLSVYALVALGRSPYTGWMGKLSAEDEKIVREAIEITGTMPFLNAHISDLSDGERQKVMIARALAQDTPIILLDEPTAHLDLPNRIEIIRLLRKLTHEKCKSILMSTHELDLALQAADKIWLMQVIKSNEKKYKSDLISGMPEELILNGRFEEAFARHGFKFDRNTGSFQIHYHTKGTFGLIGEGALALWTKRALERMGFKVLKDTAILPRVEINNDLGVDAWRYYSDSEQNETNFLSITELIEAIQANHKISD